LGILDVNIVFLRHPSTAAAGLCYGHADVGLSENARAEIRRALEITPTARRIVSSDLSRALVLASRLGARDGVRVERDPRLRELHLGEWESRPWESLDRRETDRWADDPWTERPPGGETMQELSRRVNAALAELDPGTVAVCHAGPIRAAQAWHGGLPFHAVFDRPVPFATPLPLTLRWPAQPL